MPHVIQRLTLETIVADQSAVPIRQRELSSWIRSDAFLKNLSGQLDRVVSEHEVLRFRKIEIEVKADDEASFQEALIDALITRITRSERAQDAPFSAIPGATERTPVERYIQDVLVFCLKNGYLPGTASREVEAEVRRLLAADPDHFSDDLKYALSRAMASDRRALERLFALVGKSQARKIVCAVFDLKGDVVDRLEAIVSNRLAAGKSPVDSYDQAEIAIWGSLLSGDPFTAVEYSNDQLLKELSESFPVGKSPDNEQEPALEKDSEIRESIYVENAGLVVLAPFFPHLFKAQGWVENRNWTGEEAKMKAVSLIDYLVYGKEESFTFDQVLNKILCGLPVHAVVRNELSLPGETAESAEELLRRVIGYWTVLKSTSPAALRVTFLQRPGKLSVREDGNWLLQVERRTEDILLERLPWGYSVIRLPWMDRILFVDW